VAKSAAAKEGLLELFDAATDAGWSFAGACRELELTEIRAYRWMGRRVTIPEVFVHPFRWNPYTHSGVFVHPGAGGLVQLA
jgi:hypothetical protein